MNEPLSEAFALAGQAFTSARAGAVGDTCADLLAEVGAAQEAMNALAAAQVVRIAQFACRGQVVDEASGAWVERDFGIGHSEEFAGAEVGPLLGLSPGSADRRIEIAAILTRKLPRTLAAMAAGSLDLWRATVIAEELREASVETCAAVEELIHPEVTGDTPRAARARVRRALLKVDPDSLRVKAAKARLERGVRQWASDLPGMTEWAVTLPAADAAKCWAAIDALAHQRHQDDPDTTLEQCRADALVDLLLGRADVSTTVTFLFPVHPDTMTGDTGRGVAGEHSGGTDAEWAEVIDLFAPDHPRAEAGVVAGVDRGCTGGPGGSGFTSFGIVGGIVHPDDEHTTVADPVTATTPDWLRVAPAGCQIPGIGIIPADVVADLATRFDTTITRALLDPATGTTLETGATTYRPPAKIARLVRLRDGTCRFPGCTHPATRCDLDHVIPWPNGPTKATNLHALCRHHHRAKHQAGWRLSMTPDGDCTWTSPLGQTYTTHPINHLQATA